MIHCSYKYKISFWLVVESISSSIKEGRVIVNVVTKRFVLFSLFANMLKDIFCLLNLSGQTILEIFIIQFSHTFPHKPTKFLIQEVD